MSAMERQIYELEKAGKSIEEIAYLLHLPIKEVSEIISERDKTL